MKRGIITISLLLASLAMLGGCVERKMIITSEPSGATVTVNQTRTGQTPFELPFKHHGTYDILITHKGYYPLHVAEPIAAPLYEQPGVDFASEVLWPGRIEDIRKLHYKLEKLAKQDDISGIMERKNILRDRSHRISETRQKRDEKRKATPLPLPTKKPQDKTDAPKQRPVAATENNDASKQEAQKTEPAPAPASKDPQGESTAKADGPELE